MGLTDIPEKLTKLLDDFEASGFAEIREKHVDEIIDSHDVDIDDCLLDFQVLKPEKAECCSDYVGRIDAVFEHGLGRRPTDLEVLQLSSSLPKHVEILHVTQDVVYLRTSRFRKYRLWCTPLNGEIPDDVPPTRHIVDVDGGYSLYQLTTPEEIRAEGRRQRNCVGLDSMGYIADAIAGRCTLYTLRKDDASVLTVEVRDGRVAQAEGRRHRSATAEERKALDDAMRSCL